MRVTCVPASCYYSGSRDLIPICTTRATVDFNVLFSDAEKRIDGREMATAKIDAKHGRHFPPNDRALPLTTWFHGNALPFGGKCLNAKNRLHNCREFLSLV